MKLTDSFASDSGHWYQKDGVPAYTIIGKNGNERATTLRDARKLDLVPSVTTIMKCAASPGLEVWKQNQVLMAALTMPRIDGESEQDYIKRIVNDSKEQGRKAAERGTLIHGALESWFTERKYDLSYADHLSGVVEAIREKFGEQEWCAEKSFATKRYGGKVDLHSESVVIDFKTKEFDADNLPEAYDENIMQLAAYKEGLDYPFARCANVYVSVTVPGLVHIVEHSPEDLMRGNAMFDALLSFWEYKNKFNV